MALFGFGKKKDERKDERSVGDKADIKKTDPKNDKPGAQHATNTGGSAPSLSSKQAAAPSASAAIEAELKDLRSKINTVLREKLGDSVDVRDTDDDLDFAFSNTQIRVVISSDEAKKEGKNLIPAIVNALVKTGVPKEALRLDERSMKGQWILPESTMKAAFTDFDALKNDKAKLLNAIRAKHDNFEKSEVAISKDGSFIISNIKLLDEDTNQEISRGVLFSDESTRNALKDSIKRRYIVAIGADAAKLKPMLAQPTTDQDAASIPLDTSRGKPVPAAITPPPEGDTTIPLADVTPTAEPTPPAKPSGNVIPVGSGETIELAGEGDAPPAATAPAPKPAINQPAQPPSGAIVSEKKPGDLPPKPVVQPPPPTSPSKPHVKNWGFKIDGSIDVEEVRVDVRSKLKDAQIDGDHLSMNYDATSRRFVITIHPAQDEAAFRKIIEKIASETGERITIQETGQMRWLMKQKDLDNWIEGKKPNETLFRIRSDADRLTGLKNYAGLPVGIELKQTGLKDLVAIDNVPENVSCPSNARSIKMLKAVVSDAIILRFAGIEDSRERQA